MPLLKPCEFPVLIVAVGLSLLHLSTLLVWTALAESWCALAFGFVWCILINHAFKNIASTPLTSTSEHTTYLHNRAHHCVLTSTTEHTTHLQNRARQFQYRVSALFTSTTKHATHLKKKGNVVGAHDTVSDADIAYGSHSWWRSKTMATDSIRHLPKSVHTVKLLLL